MPRLSSLSESTVLKEALQRSYADGRHVVESGSLSQSPSDYRKPLVGDLLSRGMVEGAFQGCSPANVTRAFELAVLGGYGSGWSDAVNKRPKDPVTFAQDDDQYLLVAEFGEKRAMEILMENLPR